MKDRFIETLLELGFVKLEKDIYYFSIDDLEIVAEVFPHLVEIEAYGFDDHNPVFQEILVCRSIASLKLKLQIVQTRYSTLNK